MARDVESLVLQMSADLRRFEKSMSSMKATADKRLNEVERRAMQADRNLSRIMGQAGNNMVSSLRRSLAEIAPTIAAAFSVQQVVAYADAWTQGRNALASAGIATADLANKQNELVDLANETRTSTEATIALYTRLSMATLTLGLSQSDTLRLTELLNKSFQSSGASTQEAASAALQLSQALASGVLQGDELRSLRESAPQLAQAIADAMGVGIGELKKLGAEGKITSDVITRAILGAGDAIEAKFAATSQTVGSALQRLDNELGRYIGGSDATKAATARMADAIIALADNLDRVIPVVSALAIIIGAGYAGSLTVAAVRTGLATAETIRYQLALITLQARQTGATAAQVALNAAMAANPIGLVITIVAALAAGLVLLAQHYNSTAQAARQLDQVVGAADTALQDYTNAVDAARKASGQERVELERKAAALRNVTLARIEDARVAAQQQIDEAVGARVRADRTRQQSGAANANAMANPSNASAAIAAGNRSTAAAAEQQARDARAEADRMISAWRRLQTGLSTAEAPPTTTRSTVVAASATKGSALSGPTPEELAAQREMLDLERQLELLRAQGREAEAIAKQREIDLINLTNRLTDAGVENAKQVAEEHIKAIATAEDAARGLEILAESNQRRIQENADAQQRENALLMDRLGYEAELARLRGDPQMIRAKERELWIEERINELLRLRPELGRTAASTQANTEADTLDAADNGAKAARSIVDVLRSDNIWEEAGRRFKDAAWDGVEQLLSQVFNQLFANQPGQGGNWLSSLGSAIFGGFKATGGSVTPGQPYIVGERRPEVFVPSTAGRIIPSVTAASSKVQGGASAMPPRFDININLEGANGDAAIERIARRAAAEGSAAAVRQSAMIARKSAPGLQARMARLGTT